MVVNSQQIALVTEHPDDIRLARHLLRSIKHELTVFDISNPTHRAQVERIQNDVVIVFHRALRNGRDDMPTVCLPKTGPKRLIVLSNCQREDTITGALDAGAHHFFDINEKSYILKVRIESALRAHQFHAMSTLEVAPFKFNVERRKVTTNGKSVHLSPREFSLAYFLFSNYDRIVYDSELMVSIWTLPSSMDSRRIDTAICRIRKKMNLYEDSTDWSLQRLRQVGYQLINHAPCNNKENTKNQEAALQLAQQHHAATNDHRSIALAQPLSTKPTYAIAG